MSADLQDLPRLAPDVFLQIDEDKLRRPDPITHALRILFLYGSVRAHSFSCLVSEESARILKRPGAETRLTDAFLALRLDRLANFRRSLSTFAGQVQ